MNINAIENTVDHASHSLAAGMPRAGSSLALLAMLFLSGGCQLMKSAPAGDPFASIRAPKPLERVKPQMAKDARGNPISPVSFEQQQNGAPTLNVPGVSIGKVPVETDKGWWERSTEKLKPKNLKNSTLAAVGLGTDEKIAKEKLAEGGRLFQEKKYDQAAKAYKEAARRWPDSLLEEDALFMLGESYFFADRYSYASDTFAGLVKKYENSRYLDRVMQRQYAIGKLWSDQGQVVYNYLPNFADKTRPWFDTAGNSIAVYEGIRLSDPTGPLADDAIMATANAHFLKGRYEDSSYHYDLLRKDYPKSEHQMQSHLLGLQSRMLSYQGAQYDATPLTEAEKLAASTLNQFGNELPEERARLIEVQNRIRVQQAERDYEVGEYYYRRAYYGAARHYYALVADRFPETAIAQMARARMDETKNLPPEPKNHFLWLGKVFGERDRSKGAY